MSTFQHDGERVTQETWRIDPQEGKQNLVGAIDTFEGKKGRQICQKTSEEIEVMLVVHITRVVTFEI